MKYIACIIAALCLLAFAPAAQAAQGAYEECFTIECLQQAKAIGLDHIVGAPASQEYADAAASMGMSVVWSANYRDRNSSAFSLAGHPATLGYYVADEPPVGDAAAVAAWANEVRAATNRHVWTVHWGCSYSQFAGYARPFRAASDRLGNDCYPIGLGGDQFTVAGGIKRLATWTRHGWFVAQAMRWASVWPCSGDPATGCPWMPNPWRAPTVSEMHWMRDCAFTAGVKTVTWFSLGAVRREGRIGELAQAVAAPYRARRKCRT